MLTLSPYFPSFKDLCQNSDSSQAISQLTLILSPFCHNLCSQFLQEFFYLFARIYFALLSENRVSGSKENNVDSTVFKQTVNMNLTSSNSSKLIILSFLALMNFDA